MEKHNYPNKRSKTSKTIVIITATAVLLGEIALKTTEKEIKHYSKAVQEFKIDNIEKPFQEIADRYFKNGKVELSEDLLPYIKDTKTKVRLAEKIAKKKDSFSYKWKSLKNCAKSTFSLNKTFSNGSILNEGCNFAIDFTVAGDLKDIIRYFSGQNISQLTLGLSILGVGLTATSIASLGSSTPVKGGVKIIKDLSKTGKEIPRYLLKPMERFTNRFLSRIDGKTFDKLNIANKGAYIKNIFTKSLDDTKDLKGLGEIFENIGMLMKNTDYKTALKIAEKIKDKKALIQLVKLSEKFGKDIQLFIKTDGDNFLNAFNKYGDNIDFQIFQKAFKKEKGFKKLLEKGPDFMKKPIKSRFLKATTRITKITGKSLKELLELLQSLIYALGAISIGAFLKLIKRKNK